MDIDEVMKKLAKVQGKISVPKNQRNNFGKYNYRNAEDILAAATPLLVAEGLTMTIEDDIRQIECPETIEPLEGRSPLCRHRCYVISTVFINGHKVGQAAAREAFTKKGMDDAQITGAASSYARKYALNGVFLLDDVKDADSQDNSGNPQPAIPKGKTVDW